MPTKRDEKMKEITERLEQGVQELFTSERYAEYLKTMSQFHRYSFNNTLLIAMQKPDATLVAGYQAWQKKFNRQVRRGEKGIQIISPAPVKERYEVEKIDPETQEPVLRPDGQPETVEVEHVVPRFKVATVFDVSQTVGEPLPELVEGNLTASVENYDAFMEAIRNVSPVPMRFDEIASGANGFYSNADKEIVIQGSMSESQTMKTAIHEVTHAMLHDRDVMKEQGVQKDQMTREVEAESIAFCVCDAFGIDTGDYSFPYIASWSSGLEMQELRRSMDAIRKTAGQFIENMTEQLQTILQEQAVTAEREQEPELVTEQTAGLKIEGHEGTWHTVDQISLMDKNFFLMEHDEYGDEAACIAVSEDGELVAEDLWNGFDEGFHEAVQEYFEEKGIVYEPEDMKMEEPGTPVEEVPVPETAEQDREKAQELASGTPEAFPPISANTQPEKGLNGMSRAEIEETVLCFAQAEIDGMGLTDEVKLLGARVYGSRSREGLYEADSDLDVVLSYSGDIREDSFFNALHESGLEIAGIPVDINPVPAKKQTLEQFMENAEKYLNGREIQALAEDVDRLAFDYDFYEYQDTVVSREDALAQLYSDISSGNIGYLEEWLHDVAEEHQGETDAVEAKELIWRLIDKTDQNFLVVQETSDAFEDHYILYDRVQGDYFSGKDGFSPAFATEEEAQERADLENANYPKMNAADPEQKGSLTFYVAECMEFPVMGEYHEGLTLKEAVELYEQIPAERMHGGKGIGFDLQDGSIYDGKFEMMTRGKVHTEDINAIPHFHDSPLVQQALAEMQDYLDGSRREERGVTPEPEERKQAALQEGTEEKPAPEPQKQPDMATKNVTRDAAQSDGTSRKDSVLKALRERQAKQKAQETAKPKQKTTEHKKGDQEL